MSMALWFGLLVAPQQTPPAAVPRTTGPDIVVTGRSLRETERAWRACIAASCPPDKEIDAALAHAENQFVAGDYTDARRTLLDTIGHVHGAAKQYPVAVADIWRAKGRIEAHLGKGVEERIGQFNSVDALKEGLARTDARIGGQRLTIGDTFIQQGRLDAGLERYKSVAEDARKRGDLALAGQAYLREVIVLNSLADLEPSWADRARRTTDRLLATSDPALAPFRDAAQLLVARKAAEKGDTAPLATIIARYRADPPSVPILLYTAPEPIAAVDNDVGNRGAVAGVPGTLPAQDGQWADVTFLVDKDGKVQDVEMAKSSDKIDERWVSGVMANIGRRVYAPVAVPAGLDGVRRVERYTLTAYRAAVTGSRVAQQGSPKIQMLDLTAEPAPPVRNKG